MRIFLRLTVLAVLVAGAFAVVAATPAAARAGAPTCPDGQLAQWFGNRHGFHQRGKLMLVDVPSGRTDNGLRVHLWEEGRDGVLPQAYWCPKQVSPDTYQLVNFKTGKCLDIKGPAKGDRVPVHQWNCHGGIGQHWEFRPYGDYYEIRNRYDNRCLDAVDWGTSNGTLLQVFRCTRGDNQLFY